MNKYVIYLLVVFEVGGGFTGFSSILAAQPWNKNMDVFSWGACIWSCFLFIFGVFAGLALIKESRYGIVSSAIYQMFQFLFISSNIIYYNVFSGAELVIGVLRGMPYVTIDIGARCIIFFNRRTDSWGFGINLIALILFVYLISQLIEKLSVNESSESTENSSIKNGQ
jgi:hypothetical protein